MMEATVKKEKTITLILNEEEAKWVRSICQNPMWVDDPADEDPVDKQMRWTFWNALEERK
jgi:hypothetical protein